MNFRKLLFPLLAEVIFLIACFSMPHRTLRAYVIFYLALLLYFFRDLSLRDLRSEIKSRGSRFFGALALTMCAVLVAFFLSRRMITSNFQDGTIAIWSDGSVLDIVLTALNSFLLRPVAEELFFRKALIRTEGDTRTRALSVAASLALCALAYVNLKAAPALMLLGICKTVLIALPFTLSYCRTKSVYIPIIAHIVLGLCQDLQNVIYDAVRFTLR